jgi:hypothetical protein
MILLGLALAAAASTMKVEGVPYGKREIIAGTWFTNFENSRFAECKGTACDTLQLRDWASIACLNGCGALDRMGRRLTHIRTDTAPEGTFEIRFVGRRGLFPHEPHYIGDGGRNVLIEHILEMRKAPHQ